MHFVVYGVVIRTAKDDMASELQIKAVESPAVDPMYGGGGDMGYDDDRPKTPEVEQIPEVGLRKPARSGFGGAKGPWGDHVGRDEPESDHDDGDQVFFSVHCHRVSVHRIKSGATP